jgi:hypothetical protein
MADLVAKMTQMAPTAPATPARPEKTRPTVFISSPFGHGNTPVAKRTSGSSTPTMK